MLSLPHRRDFPLRLERGFEHDMGRKRWICEACLDTLLYRWLQWCSAGRFGLRVFAISGRSVLVVALAPPVSAWLRVSLRSNALQAPAHSHECQGHCCPSTWDTSCWRCVSPRVVQGCCRAARTPKDLFWALTSAGALEEGDESSSVRFSMGVRLNWGCLFVTTKCERYFSFPNAEI